MENKKLSSDHHLYLKLSMSSISESEKKAEYNNTNFVHYLENTYQSITKDIKI